MIVRALCIFAVLKSDPPGACSLKTYKMQMQLYGLIINYLCVYLFCSIEFMWCSFAILWCKIAIFAPR